MITDNAPELTPVREIHRFDEAALADHLRRNLDGGFDDLTVLQFEGGQSNPTYQLRAGDRKFVLRKKPPGILLKSAHAVDREYRVMHALRDSAVPVPKMYLLCEDDSVIGTPFYVMEYVEGRVIADPQLPTLTNEERGALYDDFIRILAALHQVDYEAVGLGDFGRPGNYYARQISRWSKQYRASETEKIESMDALMDWLPENIPALEETSLIHGDYRIGNCIIHPTEPKIVAVIDWEISTIGNPFGDVGYCCIGYHNERLGGDASAYRDLGIPVEEELVARYCELTGREGIENWTFCIVYNLFRMAAIVQGVYKRGLDGNASSDRWMERRDQTRSSAERAWSLVQENGL